MPEVFFYFFEKVFLKKSHPKTLMRINVQMKKSNVICNNLLSTSMNLTGHEKSNASLVLKY